MNNLKYYEDSGFSHQQLIDGLLVAGIIGLVVKHNASISGAECGCQAEVGTACSMAAAAFAYLNDYSMFLSDSSSALST